MEALKFLAIHLNFSSPPVIQSVLRVLFDTCLILWMEKLRHKSYMVAVREPELWSPG
jgi:hypothetical protein